nr:universal stress protein [Microvirga sp. BSC39]
MVNREVDQPYRTALAAVDVCEPSVSAIMTGITLGFLGGTRLALVHAFLPLAKGQMFRAGFSRGTIDGYVAEERVRTSRDLIKFLYANGLDHQGWSIRLEEGSPLEVISKTAEQLRPDVLVIGTHGRKEIARAFLGSVTEEVMRSLDVDVLAVPPLR